MLVLGDIETPAPVAAEAAVGDAAAPDNNFCRLFFFTSAASTRAPLPVAEEVVDEVEDCDDCDPFGPNGPGWYFLRKGQIRQSSVQTWQKNCLRMEWPNTR